MRNYSSKVNYIENFLNVTPRNAKVFDTVFEAMLRYDTEWWHDHDEGYKAYMQFDEPVLLVPIDTFKRGVEKVIGRTVSYKELSKKNDSLREEFSLMYPKYKISVNS